MKTYFGQLMLMAFDTLLITVWICVDLKVIIFYFNQNLWFKYSKELSQWDGSFEYQKRIHLNWLVRKQLQFYAKKFANLNICFGWNRIKEFSNDVVAPYFFAMEFSKGVIGKSQRPITFLCFLWKIVPYNMFQLWHWQGTLYLMTEENIVWAELIEKICS